MNTAIPDGDARVLDIGAARPRHAERDIEDIHGYIARNDSVVRADRVLNSLEELCNSLAELPERENVPMELSDLGITE